jgi:hypothetical protein
MTPKIIPFLLLMVISTNTFAMSIEEAYKAISHKRTVFEGFNSKLDRQKIESLNQLFDLTEQGIVIRVESLNALYEANFPMLEQHLREYRSLNARISALNVPVELKPVQELIYQAIALHQGYFEKKLKDRKQYSQQEIMISRDLHLASQKLHQSFETLVKIYPAETAHNKAAFEDYMCALDFY